MDARDSSVGAPALPGTAWRPPARWPALAVRLGADRRLVAGAVAGGVSLDLAFHGGFTSAAGTVWIIVIATALWLGGRLTSGLSRSLIAAAAVLSLLLAFRSSVWVTAPAGL